MKRIIAAAMAVCLLALAGCGADGKGTVKEGLYYEATGIPPDAALLTVNGRKVTADRYLYWLTYNCDYIARFFGDSVDWEEDRDGETLADYVKETSLDSTVLYTVIEEWAERYGVELTADDRAAMEREYGAYCESYGGEDAYLQVLADLGADKALAQSYSADYYLYSRLYDLFCQEGSKLAPEDGALEQYQAAKGLATVDYILVSTGESAGNTAALAERRQRAEEVLGKLQASQDPNGYFATLAGTYSDADREAHPEGVTFAPGDGALEAAAETAALALEENAYSTALVEGEKGFYILLRKPVNQADVSAAYFDERIQAAAEEAEVEPSSAYRDLAPAAFYDKLLTLRSGTAQAAGDGAPEGSVPAGDGGQGAG